MFDVNFFINESAECLYIRPVCDLTESVVDEFSEKYLEKCNQNDQDIVLDFQDVKFLSSRALGSLVKFYKLQKKKNNRFALVNVSKQLFILLDSVNITKVIPILDKIEEYDFPHDNKKNRSKGGIRAVIEKKDNVTIIAFQKNTGSGSGMSIKKVLRKVKSNQVVVNFEKISEMSQEVISVIADISERLRKNNGVLVLTGVNDLIMDVFSILQLKSSFHIAGDINQALRIIEKSFHQ